MRYFERQLQPYCSLPAGSGARDPSLAALVKSLDLSDARVLLDYGCGQGRLLSALIENRQAPELALLSYIGIDSHSASLDAARAYFETHVAATEMRAAFLRPDDLVMEAFLVDEVVLVFSLHELDPLHLDRLLSVLWRMVRTGGRLHIQDTADPIHQEIEFLAFTHAQIRRLLGSLTTQVSVSVTKAGKREVDVFLATARKLPADTKHPHRRPYRLLDLSAPYREILHESLLRLGFQLHEARARFEAGEPVEADELAALCHQIAVRARAYHQTIAFDEVNGRKSQYCVKCGGPDVSVDWEDGGRKLPSVLTVSCFSCSYEHQHVTNRWFVEDEVTTELRFMFQEDGAGRSERLRRSIEGCVRVWPAPLRAIGAEVLARTPGVSRALIQEVLAEIGPPLLIDG